MNINSLKAATKKKIRHLRLAITNGAVPEKPLPPTIKELQKRYSPPITFGKTAEATLAMDSALEEFGLYSKLQDMFSMGLSSAVPPQFLGYPFLSGLTQNGLIRAGVETLADEMANGWIKLNRIGEKEDGAFKDKDRLSALNREIKRFKVKDVFHKGAEFCGYFGGGLVYIDTGVKDPQALREPLILDSATFKKGSLKGFVPVEPVNLYPGLYNSSDPLSDDYFKPQTWWVLGREVHASRFLKFIVNEPPMLLLPAYNFFGVATAQLAVDYVAHFTQDRESASRLLNKFSLTIFKTDMTTVLSGGNRDQLDRRMQLFTDSRDNDAVEVIDKEGEDIVQINTPISGVTEIVRQALELMAVVFRMPAVKLLGISPSGFNATGESDLDNWHEHVLSQESKMWKTPLDRALKVLQLNAFGDIDDTIDFEFAELGRRDETATATVNKTKADIDALYLEWGVLSAEEVRKRLAGDPDGGYHDIDADNAPEEEMPRAESVADANPFALDDWKEGDHPRSKDGKFGSGGSSGGTSAEEKQKKINSIKIDFKADNVLPGLNSETLKELGKSDKPVLLKKHIIDKNKANHPDVMENEYKEIIGQSLYNPETILPANKDKPAYHNFVKRVGEDKSTIVLLEIAENKDNYEIVNLHWIDDYGVKKKMKKS